MCSIHCVLENPKLSGLWTALGLRVSQRRNQLVEVASAKHRLLNLPFFCTGMDNRLGSGSHKIFQRMPFQKSNGFLHPPKPSPPTV